MVTPLHTQALLNQASKMSVNAARQQAGDVAAAHGFTPTARGVVASGVVPGSTTQQNRQRRKEGGEHEGLALKAVDKVDHAGSMFFMGDIATFMGGGAIAGIGGALHKMAGWSPFGGNWLKAAGSKFKSGGDFIKKPRTFMENTTLGDVTGTAMETAGDLVGATLGHENGLGQSLRSGQAAERAGLAFRNATTSVGEALQKGEKGYAPIGRFQARRAQAMHEKLQEALGKTQTALDKHEATLRNAGESLTEKASAGFLAEGAKEAAQLTANEHLDVVRERLNSISEKINTAKTAQELEGASGLLEEARSSMGALFGLHETHVNNGVLGIGRTKSTAGEALAELNQGFKAMAKPLEKVPGRMASAEFWQNPEKALEGIPSRLANTNLHTAAFNGAITAGMVAQGAHLGYGIHHDLKALEKLAAQVQGNTKPVSGWALLTGDVPPVIRTARNQLIRQYGPQVVVQGVMDVFNIALMKSGRMGGAAIAAMVGIPMAAQAVSGSGPSMLQAEQQLAEAQANGQEISHGAYVTLLEAACPELSEPVMHACAAKFEKEQTTAVDVLKAVNGNQLEEIGLGSAKQVLNDKLAKGEKLTHSDYVGFVCVASKDARECGPANRLVQSMAEAYAQEQLAPEAVMHEIEGHRFNQRALELQNKLMADGHKPGESLDEQDPAMIGPANDDGTLQQPANRITDIANVQHAHGVQNGLSAQPEAAALQRHDSHVAKIAADRAQSSNPQMDGGVA